MEEGVVKGKNIFDVRLVSPTAPEYVAWGRANAMRARQERPVWGGTRRDPGEKIGGLVEACVVRLLGEVVGPSEPRILAWCELVGARGVSRFREIDFVTRPDAQTLVLWEIKLTTEANIARGHGLTQLAASGSLLAQSAERGKRLLHRVVYVASGVPKVCAGAVPIVAAGEFDAEVGAVIIHPSEVERMAHAVGIALPLGWSESRTRPETTPDAPRTAPGFAHSAYLL